VVLSWVSMRSELSLYHIIEGSLMKFWAWIDLTCLISIIGDEKMNNWKTSNGDDIR